MAETAGLPTEEQQQQIDDLVQDEDSRRQRTANPQCCQAQRLRPSWSQCNVPAIT